MQYRIRPDCGAHLDPDERCDCKEERAGCEAQTAHVETTGCAVNNKFKNRRNVK